jgi:Nucleotidyltransferase domain
VIWNIFYQKPADAIMNIVEQLSQLNQKLWQDNVLKPEVRDHLIQIAQDFLNKLDIKIQPKDIILTGSNANYNYTPSSDLDLHIVVDLSQSQDPHIVDDYLGDEVHLWNDHHNITIHGAKVELYSQRTDAPLHASGVYSLLHKVWIRTPSPLGSPPDETSVDDKSLTFADEIVHLEDMLKNGEFKSVSEKAHGLMDRLKLFRAAGLSSIQGEFSVENFAFKKLRNTGWIERLMNLLRDSYDREYSIESLNA